MSTLTSKGQTTIPLEVRQKLGLNPRQRLVYEIDGNTVRVRAAAGSLVSSAGVLKESDNPGHSPREERELYRKERGNRYR